MGELLYRLKFRGDQTTIEPIVETVVVFLASWNIQIDAIVPVPPSNASRKNQPVIEVAKAISARTGIPLCESCVAKIKSTAQLKNVFDRDKREGLLTDAFGIDAQKTRAKRLLIFDDLYRSGATASAVARGLTEQGGASAVYLLTLTQTRKNL
jgi:predicted amidophosphoribosyltransferase